MPDLSLIMLGAGDSTRFNLEIKKQWLRFDKTPLWLFVTQNISKNLELQEIIVTASKDEINYMQRFDENIKIIHGGKSRQESLKNALLHVNTPYVLVSDVARVCIPNDMIERIIEKKKSADIVVPYIDVSDTVVYKDETINRDKVKLIQTPQLSKTEILKKALESETIYTDDSSAIKATGGKVVYVKGDKRAHKLTFLEDLKLIECKKVPSKDIYIGNGFDVHPFEEGKEMYLGGVKIRDDVGFKAHSDGDVVIHALIDSILGAIGAGDIGELFPDSDDKYKNIDSKELLKRVVDFTYKIGFEIKNCDITIMAETPKLGEFKDKMRKTLAKILNIEPIYINIKATTTEKLGFIGRKEGVGVLATSLVKFIEWDKI